MPVFNVMVGFYCSQAIEVETDDLESAMNEAISRVDGPNVSNAFEQSGDPEVIAVYDDNGSAVFEAD